MPDPPEGQYARVPRAPRPVVLVRWATNASREERRDGRRDLQTHLRRRAMGDLR